MHPSRSFHKATRNADSSWLVFPHWCWTLSHADLSLLLSDVDCPSASPVANCLLWVPSSNWLFCLSRTCLSYPTSGLVRDLESRPLFGFTPKQTKRSSAWRFPFIVSQKSTILQVFFFFFLLIIIRSGRLAEIKWSACMSKKWGFCVSHSPGQMLSCAYTICSYSQI